MSAPPYIPLYVADYHADTTHLSRGEHGAYLLLLMAMWRAGGRLPATDDRLARLAMCTPEEWADMRSTIMEFFKRRGGHITHKRIAAEIAKYENRIVRSRKGGKQTASKNANENSEKTPILAAPKVNQPKPEPEPIYLEDKSSKRTDDLPDHDALAWSTAKDVLTAQGGMTERAAAAFFGKLLSQHGIEARDMLAATMAAGVNKTRDPQGYLTKAAQAVEKRRAPVKKAVGFV
jgi:uncharacterized protein YdaU (DUF1376 family)